MEDVKQFERWLGQMLKDSKEKLAMTNASIAYILMREGLAYFYRAYCCSSDVDSSQQEKTPQR